jgi:hypothetical protein
LAVLSPPVNDLSHHESIKRAFNRMEFEAARVNFKPEDFKHKRGENFVALNIGLSYGLGHTKPTRPDLGDYSNLADALLKDAL